MPADPPRLLTMAEVVEAYIDAHTAGRRRT